MARQLANFSTTTLNDPGGISAGDTTIVLTSGTSFPAADFTIRIEDELIKIASRSGNTLTVETTPSSGRGAESTTPASHADGTAVYGPLTLLALQEYILQEAANTPVGGQATGQVDSITIADTHGTSGTTSHHARGHAMQGTSDHTNVAATAPADNDLWQYNSGTAQWGPEPASAHGAHGGGGGGRGAFDALVYKSSSTAVTAVQPDGTVISGPSGTDLTVIQAAIDYVDALTDGNGGTVHMSAGFYDIASGTITGRQNVRLHGDGVGGRTGDGGAIVLGGTVIRAGTANQTLITVPDGAYGFVVDNIALSANGQSNTTGISIVPGDTIVTHTYVGQCRTGIWVRGGDTGHSKAIRIEHSFIEGANTVGTGNAYGIRVEQSGGTDPPTDGGIHECRILHYNAGTTNYGCYIAEGGWQLSDIHWTNARTGSGYDCYVPSGASPIMITNCYFDSHGTNALFLGGNNQATVSNNYLLWGPTGGSIMVISGTGVCSIIGNRFNGGTSNNARWGIELLQNPLTANQLVISGNHGKNFAANGGLIGFQSTVVPNGIVRANPNNEGHPYVYIDGNVRTQTA